MNLKLKSNILSKWTEENKLFWLLFSKAKLLDDNFSRLTLNEIIGDYIKYEKFKNTVFWNESHMVQEKILLFEKELFWRDKSSYNLNFENEIMKDFANYLSGKSLEEKNKLLTASILIEQLENTKVLEWNNSPVCGLKWLACNAANYCPVSLSARGDTDPFYFFDNIEKLPNYKK